MKLVALPLVLLLATLAIASAIPKPGEEDHKNRVIDKELSDQQHYEGDDDDDDENHVHNSEYDHEAFLGREDSKTFDQLTPEESKEGLSKIYDKIDKDNDGVVTEAELKQWIKHVQNKYIEDDTNRQWKEHDVDADEKLIWETYKKRTYGYLEDDGDEDDDGDSHGYKEMLSRDERRWKKADTDSDGKLNKEEFMNFLHPEDAEHMRDVVIDETLEDIDKDKDGLISLEEYIADMWPNNEDGEEEPDWVKTEREQFASFRDKNNDGHMDREEVKDWILPSEYDHAEAEAKHLILQSDEDKDGQLTKNEVLDKYDLFVGSQATDFGEALTRHDEF